MNYEPVKLCTLFEVRTDLKTGKVRQSPNYFQVRSKSLGTCGHRHTTAQAAEPCLTRMKTEFRRLRSEKAKASWAKRQSA